MSSPFKRVLVPLRSAEDGAHTVAAASILASWFNAPIQLICSDPAAVEGCQILAAGLGTLVEPVLELDESGTGSSTLGVPSTSGVTAHAHSCAPSLLVVEATEYGRKLAAESTQPVFLIAETAKRRMPLGPLTVEITGQNTDLDALAVAAVVGQALEEPARLVVSVEADGDLPAPLDAAVQNAELKLRQMGCEVGVDRLRPNGVDPQILLSTTREATAMVVPQHRLAEEAFVDRALEQSVHLLIAPPHRDEAGRAAPFNTDLTASRSEPPAGAALEVLDRAECQARLDRHTLGRLGYVEAGWPTVVPVNYRTYQGDILIRSLDGGKLRAAERRDTVCLELDGYDEQLRSGWSVIAHGMLEVITDPSLLSAAWANDPEPWVAAQDWQWLRLVPFSVSGREALPGT